MSATSARRLASERHPTKETPSFRDRGRRGRRRNQFLRQEQLEHTDHLGRTERVRS